MAGMADNHIENNKYNKNGYNTEHQKEQNQHGLLLFHRGDDAATILLPAFNCDVLEEVASGLSRYAWA
jgi:hypothetical protein